MNTVVSALQGWINPAIRRRSFYAWRDSLTFGGRLCLMFAATIGLGLCSQIIIPLPFTPVPLSLQTCGAAVAAVSLGRGWGAGAVAAYIAGIALGIPWTVGGSGGTAVFTGPTGGYLVGFILEAAVLSTFSSDLARCRRLTVWGAIFACDIVLILTPGTLWLWSLLEAGGHPAALTDAAAKGFFPFVAVDTVKSGLAAAVIGRR
ncbi:MAG: biotin transporter BioY [Desulfovibrio sp.]|jgi:biotin transport system substrate-specific component|nr:biotin transporter BioY [Desulfovibrio sp.]